MQYEAAFGLLVSDCRSLAVVTDGSRHGHRDAQQALTLLESLWHGFCTPQEHSLQLCALVVNMYKKVKEYLNCLRMLHAFLRVAQLDTAHSA